jgi:hypothetical protein
MLYANPETFTFGGMFAHVITFNAYRRMVAIDVLRDLGVKVEGVPREPGEGVRTPVRRITRDRLAFTDSERITRRLGEWAGFSRCEGSIL